VLSGLLENPATALAVGGERWEAVALDVGAFVPVTATTFALVDATGRHELAGPERCAVFNHEVPLCQRLCDGPTRSVYPLPDAGTLLLCTDVDAVGSAHRVAALLASRDRVLDAGAVDVAHRRHHPAHRPQRRRELASRPLDLVVAGAYEPKEPAGPITATARSGAVLGGRQRGERLLLAELERRADARDVAAENRLAELLARRGDVAELGAPRRRR
jgi:hypothetical protein